MKHQNQPLSAGAIEELEALPQSLLTNEAAKCVNRRPQTLRKWACLENGPIKPLRINGRLHWLVADLRKLLSGEAK